MARDNTTGGSRTGLPSVSGTGLPAVTGGGTPAQNQAVVVGPPIPTNPNYNAFVYTENGKPVYWDVSSAKKRFDILNTQQLAPLVKAMDDNYGRGNWKWSDVKSGWDRATDMAASYKAAYGQDVSIWDTFNILAQRNATNGLSMSGRTTSGGGGGGAGGTGTSYAIQKSVNLTDPSTARGLINQTLSQYLGRKANAKEQEAFLKALNAQEQMSPSVTEQRTTTTRAGSATATSATSETTGGFNPATFAEEWAAGQQGAGEFQAATNLLDSFIQAIGAKV